MNANRGPGCSVILVALIFGIIGGGIGATLLSRYAPRSIQQIVSGGGISVMTDKDAIVQAVAKAAPAVVTITATSTVEATGPFGIPMGTRTARSLGSGFFFDYSGKKYILTNAHVVQGAQSLTIRTTDGHEYKAKIVSESPQDLAVIAPEGVPAAQPTLPLGNSDAVPVGSWVIAIGSPFGIDNTVTVGVVSRKGLTPLPPEQGGSRPLIQTDAAINEGNSGGPLIDLGGNVIGVNEMILSPTQTNLGIGFAIPVNQAKELLYFLVNRGPWIGVGTIPNSPGLAHYAGLETTEGVVVTQVAPASPAAKAGLQPKDVILQIDAQPVRTTEDVQKQVLTHKIGETVTVLIQRGKDRKTLQVQTGTVPAGAS